MLTETQKSEILQLIEDEKLRLSSYRAVAAKCKISESSISLLRKGSYAADGDDIYTTIAIALGYEFEASPWVISTETTNYRIVAEVLADAKSESMFMGIAHKAGAGKTASSDDYVAKNKFNSVFKLNCKEWSGRAFLQELCREIGAEPIKGYASLEMLLNSISEASKKMAFKKPLFILDQANSLKPSAIRTIIHIFNECEDFLGLVVLGTENLEYEIKRGVRLQKLGYDEIDSRFGRTYIHLIGATMSDCRKICAANGVDDPKAQHQIFQDSNPVKREIEDGNTYKTIQVVEDIRVIKRKIKGYKLVQKHS